MVNEVKVDVGELTRLSSRSKDLNTEIGVTFNKINGTLSEISSIIKSGYITGGNQKLKETISIISNNVKNSLININEFLDSQLSNYNTTVEEALNDLRKLITFLDDTFAGSATSKNGDSFTTTSEYDVTNLHEFLVSYEGTGKMRDGKYVVYVDSDGSLTAGPGMHLSNIKGINVNDYQKGSVISKEIIDDAVNKTILNTRQKVENALATEQFSNVNLNDAQIDSLTSLLYNTGKSPSYFLKKYQEAQSQGTTLYDYCTQYWVNSNGTKLPGLVNRRMGENILFEQGYDAWKQSRSI